MQDIQFLGIRLRLDLGVALVPESKAQEIAVRACKLSSLRPLSYHQVAQLMGSLSWASGLIPLGRLYLRPLQRYFHSLGLTDRFTPPRQSDPLVLAILLQQWQDLSFLTSGIPIRPFQAGFAIFTDASTRGWCTHMGDSQISGTWAPLDRQFHISCLELKAVEAALHHWAPVVVVVVVGLPLHVVTHGHSLAVGAGFSTLLYGYFSFFLCFPYFLSICFLFCLYCL